VDSNKSDAMTLIVNIQEAQTNLSMLIQRVIAGEEIIIAQSGEPVARLIPYSPQPIGRLPGSAQGKIWIAPNFDAPLPDEIIDLFEGSAST
jgi:prevent-host-death family protein